jgi:hypothetical protein
MRKILDSEGFELGTPTTFDRAIREIEDYKLYI